MIRSILAVMGGFLAGSLFNMAFIMLSWTVYPPPAGANLSDPATMNSYIASLPIGAFLIVLVAHEGGALVGGCAAALIGARFQLILGAIVGGLFLLGGIVNVLSMPAPLWFEVIDLLLFVPCGILGAKLVR